MKRLLCLSVIFFSLLCTAQDSIVYKGMKMTVQESDTLKNMLETNNFPPFISFISNGCCVTKNDDYLCPDIVCLPDETNVYVCRKSGDKYLCIAYGHTVFINKKDINTKYDVDLLLNNSSRIYRKFRIEQARLEALNDFIKTTNSLISFYAKKPVIIMDYSIIDDDLGMKGLNIKLLNNSSKTIKNIWVTFTGYNENDKPIIDIYKKINVTKAINTPIRKDYISAFNFNHIWDTDLLSYSLVKILKIQYMDNSIKLINNIDPYCLNHKLRQISDTIHELTEFMEQF